MGNKCQSDSEWKKKSFQDKKMDLYYCTNQIKNKYFAILSKIKFLYSLNIADFVHKINLIKTTTILKCNITIMKKTLSVLYHVVFCFVLCEVLKQARLFSAEVYFGGKIHMHGTHFIINSNNIITKSTQQITLLIMHIAGCDLKHYQILYTMTCRSTWKVK